MSATASFVMGFELLAKGQFPRNWEPMGPKSQWELNPADELIQKALVGSRKLGTGAILAQKEASNPPAGELNLTCRPGSQHQVGVIFNLVDEKNFCAFCIDQHSSRTRGYDLVVFEVEDGDYNVVSKESYTITQPETAVFTLRQMGSDLQFLFNDALAYTWAEKSLSGKRVGIYSYKNNDAAFLSLSIYPLSNNPLAMGVKVMGTEPVKSDGNVVSQPQPIATIQPIMPLDNRDGITEFLNIKKPASKTEIEFTEVFTVPLDSFYSSLYQNSSLDSSNNLVTNSTSEVQLLDLRIKRWYRDLKAVRENLVFAKTDLERKRKKVKEAEDQINHEGLGDDKYSEWEKKLAERRADYHIALRRVNNLRDQEGLILREIRVNGYKVEEKRALETVKAMGYDFHIYRLGLEPGQYEPLKFDEKLDLSDDTMWKATELKLYDELFETNAITPKGKELYPREREQLVNFDACPSLVETAEQIKADITHEEELRLVYENTVIKDAETEITAWEADKTTLLRQRDTYTQTRDPDHETIYGNFFEYPYVRKRYDAAVGWLNLLEPSTTNSLYPSHPDFQTSFLNIGKGKRVRLNRLIVDIYEENTKHRVGSTWVRSGLSETQIPEHWELTLFRAFALYCPEAGANYYHWEKLSYSAPSHIPPTADPENSGWELNLVDVSTNDNAFIFTTQKILDFFAGAVQICDYFIGLAKSNLESAKLRLREFEDKINVHKQRLEDIKQHGLSRERRKFLEKWNDPATNLTSPIGTHVHPPDEDPLAEFLLSIAGQGDEEGTPVDMYFFAPTPDGFYNQNGLSLQEFMKTSPAGGAGQDVICVFPVFDSQGRISNEMIKAVRNPQRSLKTPSLPMIKFVESYRVEVGWLGYGLGELSHSFNLFPGESKELVIEKSTKLKTKLEESRKTSEETTSKQTSSFEDILQNELSVGEKAAQESSSAAKQDSSQSASTEDESTSEFSIEAEAEGSFGFGSASAKTGAKFGSRSKRNTAWATSQSAEEKRASNQSKDVLSKNVSNAIRKVASETSQNNKLEFSAVSSREYEESTSNREVINLQNPNVGRTVNYNFFQVQNLFGVTVKLMDVQVVIDSGMEMVKGTDINDVRVYELEEFGKVYANGDGSDRSAALAAIIVRQVMKHYGDFAPGVTSGNGAVGVGAGYTVQKEMLEVLNFSSESGDASLKDRIERIKTALEYLKGVPFRFRETVLTSESTVAVNCGAYHVESQLGFLPATEAYLEIRREIETDKQRAQVAHLKAQTEAKVFFPELPEGITTFTTNGKATNLVSSDTQGKS